MIEDERPGEVWRPRRAALSGNEIRCDRGRWTLPLRTVAIVLQPSDAPWLGWTRRTGVTPRAPVRPHGTELEYAMPPKLIMRPSQATPERVRALQLFREWDAVMVKHHGTLYHRKLGYTLH